MQVQLDQFEGPLALLLYLIRKEEMDIYDIPIHHITQQYLNHVKQLKNIDLEKAGDFIAMAASLIQIKAKMLLPTYGEDGQVLEQEDPRKPLVQRLLEYQKYQEAGKLLYERPLLDRDVWARAYTEKIEGDEGDLIIDENALFGLISAYRSVIKKAQKATHKVANKLQSIASRVMEFKDKLIIGKWIELRELMAGEEFTVRRLIITFISGLELGKLGYVKLNQEENCGPLYLEPIKEITGDITSQVDEFENDYDSIQNKMFSTDKNKNNNVFNNEELSAQEEAEIERLADRNLSSDTNELGSEAQTAAGFAMEDSATDEEIMAALQEEDNLDQASGLDWPEETSTSLFSSDLNSNENTNKNTDSENHLHNNETNSTNAVKTNLESEPDLMA